LLRQRFKLVLRISVNNIGTLLLPLIIRAISQDKYFETILNSLYFKSIFNDPNSFIILGIVEDSVRYKRQGLIDKPRLSFKLTMRALAKEFKLAKYI
jgi:hypothetical protein